MSTEHEILAGFYILDAFGQLHGPHVAYAKAKWLADDMNNDETENLTGVGPHRVVQIRTLLVMP